MQRSSRPDDLVLKPAPKVSASRARSRSGSTPDQQIPSSASTESSRISPLINVNPAPAYIAPSAAARLVTSDHESFFRSLQDEGVIGPGMPTILVNAGSLALVNQFLDFLLHSILSNAKSTSLSALRPAVTEILRIRLAREAVAGADQELKSYLGGDDEDLESFDDASDPVNRDEWKLESTWKKCRVQCMVYSSLGDLEEDDEVLYSEYGLEGSVGIEQYQRQSSMPGIVSPAVAIWLTSILEFIGEQTLLVAGHASIARYSAQRIAVASNLSPSASSGVTFPEQPIVEELDTEKVALNPSLGRMWRQWRKKVRGGRGSISLPSGDGVLQPMERQAGQRSTSRGEEIVPADDLPIQNDCSEQAAKAAPASAPSEDVDSIRSAILSESTLTPIAEQIAPRISSPRMLGVRNGDDSQTNIPRRPQSLIILPWTTSPPFVLSTAVRRPVSLPDLKRGDFADPSAESENSNHSPDKDVEEVSSTLAGATKNRPCYNIPLPHPGPDEEHELPATSTSDQVIDEDRRSTKVVNPSEHENQYSAIVEPKTVEPEDIQRGDSQITLDRTAALADSNDELASATQQLQHVLEDDEYDPYAAKPSQQPVMTPTRSETFFFDEGEASPSNNQGRVDMVPTAAGGHRTSHSKHHSSARNGVNSLSEHKIGQVQLISSSASMQSIPPERAGNARVFTPPTTPDTSRRSSSFSKIQRPIHTSGSASSQASILKTFIPWPHDGAKYSKVHHESDGESRSSHHSERLARHDDKERSFEELISSGGTIHCTITPDPIRNMEKGRDSPSQKTPTADLADFFRSTGPDGRPVASSRTVPNSPRTPVHRSPAPTPMRDLRSNGSTTSSISDFLKNTAPQRSPGYAFSHSSGGSNSRLQSSMSMEGGKEMTPSTKNAGLPAVIRQTGREGHPQSKRPKNRLMAREASGTTGSETTSALADFFRNTNPPMQGEAPVHRISRSVAPFRDTMDSAHFNSSTDPDIIEQTEHDSTSTTARSIVSAPQESYSSSFTSSTALLRTSSKKTVDYGGTSTALPSMPNVKRKQTRAQDPYAIAIDGLDDTDIDDMEGLNLVLPRKREEESLVDFLRNTPPPPSTAPQPFIQTNPKTVQKKGSAVSLMSRFGRSSRKNSIASNTDKMPLGTPLRGSPQPKYVPLLVSNPDEPSAMGHSSSGSDHYQQPAPHVQTDLHSRSDQYPRSSHSATSRIEFDTHRAFSNAPMPRNPSRPNVHPRQPQAVRNDTDSLANFLKHTGPPKEARTAHPDKEESRSLLPKISFSRNKKLGVA
ncbi:hypothetical protein FN846DRAFT_1009590 [Sphaerosporella brunnea]|uniref:Uncharacterized protein n=1 Tax=Sphaerosporella brunnea TaxID=1250544 RepID=A0A5J5EB65_9PEZI|nr:hypothetical protein FN846DRAFT_1009590 [Sphaerosporella brunnea]